MKVQIEIELHEGADFEILKRAIQNQPEVKEIWIGSCPLKLGADWSSAHMDGYDALPLDMRVLVDYITENNSPEELAIQYIQDMSASKFSDLVQEHKDFDDYEVDSDWLEDDSEELL